MKKQQKTYLLLIAVFVVWGIIGYRIYSRLNPEIPKFKMLDANVNFIKENDIAVRFYELKNEYRDPFLGKFPQKKKTVRKNSIQKPKIQIPFPNVIYNGIVDGNSKSYILTVNNQQEILKIGEDIREVKLIKANTKEAVVSFKGVKKTITLQ